MIKIKPLPPKLLCLKCDPKQFDFGTTAELPELVEPLGQERALAAIEFGIRMQESGYNLYLLGPKGTGKHHLIHEFLNAHAKLQLTPDDWCYVHNFEDPEKPLALRLPAGVASFFKKELATLIEALRTQGKVAVRTLMGDLQNKYRLLPSVGQYLAAVEADIIKDHAMDFSRYEVNILVSHLPGSGAPIIYENHPTQENLMGCIEYSSQSGGFIAHFNSIRAGALHAANGGYLILDAQQLINYPYAWDSLKRALYLQKITLGSSDQSTPFPHITSLVPASIPLQVKIILLGERNLYYLLCEEDAYFTDLFKVAADFSNHIGRTSANIALFSRLIATMTQREKGLPLNRHAVAKIIDYSSRLANDRQRLYTNHRFLSDLLHEANYWARQEQRQVIKAIDIQKTIDQQIYRANRIESRVLEDFKRNILLVETKGKKIGQVNGLSVLEVGHYCFGTPSRITATVRLGKGEVIDIEREVELGGPLHSKGVLILSGFLSGRYLVEHHLSIAASLVFEQNYGEIDGDSAAAAELAALLSAISRLPVKQSFALTGSVNQCGQIQAIGNLNEKIEGFFSICQAQGLTHQQGVIIPASNVQHLMLKSEIVEAAKKKNFFIYAVETIDQVMTILTGLPAGKANSKGHFPENTVNGHIEEKLLKYAERADGENKLDEKNTYKQ